MVCNNFCLVRVTANQPNRRLSNLRFHIRFLKSLPISFCLVKRCQSVSFCRSLSRHSCFRYNYSSGANASSLCDMYGTNAMSVGLWPHFGFPYLVYYCRLRHLLFGLFFYFYLARRLRINEAISFNAFCPVTFL